MRDVELSSGPHSMPTWTSIARSSTAGSSPLTAWARSSAAPFSQSTTFRFSSAREAATAADELCPTGRPCTDTRARGLADLRKFVPSESDHV